MNETDHKSVGHEPQKTHSAHENTVQCPLGIDVYAFLKRVDTHSDTHTLDLHDKIIANSCMLCRQCTQMTPPPLTSTKATMTQVCVDIRHNLVENNAMPPSAFHFALDELHASTRRPVTLFMGDPYHTDIDYAFFPGCQLSGARWKQVLDVYKFLRTQIPMGLMLSCCGTPAHWAGQDDLVTESVEHIVLHWNTLGQPTLVMACASCLQFFKETMPHIPCVSLWEVLYKYKDAMPVSTTHVEKIRKHTYCIQDPCGARYNDAWHEHTRLLASHCAVNWVEADNHKHTSQCCGAGGLTWCAHPKLATQATEALAKNLGAHKGLASCSMCRDRLVEHGKACLHFFDILPMLTTNSALTPSTQQRHNSHEKTLTLSAKRANRVRLAREVMNIYGTSSIVQEAYTTREPLPLRSITDCALLYISPELLTELERKHILHQDAAAAVRAIETHKQCFFDEESGHYLGAWQSGEITFWVRYSKKNDDLFQLHDAWRHRTQLPNGKIPESKTLSL